MFYMGRMVLPKSLFRTEGTVLPLLTFKKIVHLVDFFRNFILALNFDFIVKVVISFSNTSHWWQIKLIQSKKFKIILLIT